MKPHWRSWLLLFVTAPLATTFAQTPATTPASDSGVPPISRSYEEAFNKRDAAAIGRLWAENGVHTDRASGQKTTGRATIQKDLEEFFKSTPGARLALNVTSTRMITPNVAQSEGTATTVVPGGEPTTVAFTTIVVKQGDSWLIDSVEESPIPQPETARSALEPIAWLEGDWADATEGVATTSTFSWSNGGNFLVRRFSTQYGEEDVTEGTQIIGWDPRAQRIRSWTFNSDGSFGEAIWSQNGNDWLVKSTQTLADGGDAAGTYVITRVDDNTMTVGLIGHEVNGEPVPSVPAITVKRQPAPQTEAASEGAGR